DLDPRSIPTRRSSDLVGVGDPGQPEVPFTPMEKSVGWPSLAVDVKLAPKKLLLKNAFWLLPHGVPTQLVPLVVKSNERPDRSPRSEEHSMNSSHLDIT